MIINHLHYLKDFFNNYLIMTLFVDIYIKLLCHTSPINITMETYMQVLQKMLKSNNYLCTYMRV
jgi:hypothetical protein